MRVKLDSSRVAACALIFLPVAWAGSAATCLMHFLGLSHLSTWGVACSLGYSGFVGLALILHELNSAPELPVCESELVGYDAEGLRAHWAAPSPVD